MNERVSEGEGKSGIRRAVRARVSRRENLSDDAAAFSYARTQYARRASTHTAAAVATVPTQPTQTQHQRPAAEKQHRRRRLLRRGRRQQQQHEKSSSSRETPTAKVWRKCFEK